MRQSDVLVPDRPPGKLSWSQKWWQALPLRPLNSSAEKRVETLPLVGLSMGKDYCPRQYVEVCGVLWGVLMRKRDCYCHLMPVSQGRIALFLTLKNCTGENANMALQLNQA